MKNKDHKRVKDVYLFPNGNFAVFDLGGSQISELQGPYSVTLHKRILIEAREDCEFKGLHILPPGFIENANTFAKHCNDKGMSWEEIFADE